MSRPTARPESGLARSAGVLGLGNVASRVIGLTREAVISGYFGSSGELSAFRLAARVPTMIYDLLVGGMLSAALVPVFSEYALPERRTELARLASAVFSFIVVAMGLLVVVVELFAAPIASLIGDFDDPALQAVLERALRLVAPAILVFGLSGGVTGLLYALRRFSYAALSGAVFNLGIVIAAPLLAGRLDIYALPIGIMGGSLLQLAVLLPGVRDMRLRLASGWRHPAVRRILWLYLPIALGLIVTQFQIIADGRWASATGELSVSWMGYATTLIQMPLGLVPVAVSLAALPSLSQKASAGDWDGFRSIFARGLRLVILFLIPATVGLWVLAEPLVGLVFEHGSFVASDTTHTAQALRLYLLGLPFAGVDFLLNYTFYARQNTRTPALVGIVAVGFYFAAAVVLKEPYGFLGLVLADSVKQFAHAAIMTVLLRQGVGRLRGHDLVRASLKVVVAALAMGASVALVVGWMGDVVSGLAHPLLGKFILVVGGSGIGAVIYLVLLSALRLREVTALAESFRRRFGSAHR